MFLNLVAWDNGYDWDKIVINLGQDDEQQLKIPTFTYRPKKSDYIKISNFDLSNLDNLALEADGDIFYFGKNAMKNMGNSGGSKKIKDDKFKDKIELLKLAVAIEHLVGQGSPDETIVIDNLAVGLNIGAFPLYAEELEDYYKGMRVRYTTPQGINRKIIINSCYCYIQGIAALNNETLDAQGRAVEDKYETKTYGTIDIGGKTIDGLVFSKGEPVAETIIKLDLGTTQAFEDVSRETGVPINIIQEAYFNQDYKIYYDNDKADSDGYHYLENKFKTAFAELADRIVDEITFKWSNFINLMEFVLLFGGGANSLDDPIANRLGKRIKVANDPQFANVKGYYKECQRDLKEI